MPGTSPRMRGKQEQMNAATSAMGNIPAHAGKTLVRTFSYLGLAEHPRACGENMQEGIRRKLPYGTSPRMRGKRHGG